MSHPFAALILSCACVGLLSAAEDATAVEEKPKIRLSELGAELQPSLVEVLFDLRFDRHLEPYSAAFPRGAGGMVEAKRPFSLPGLLVGEGLVLAQDPVLQQRFIAGVRLRRGDNVVTGRIVGYARDQGAMLIEPQAALPKTRPLAFGAAREDAVVLARTEFSLGRWTLQLQPLGLPVELGTDGRSALRTPSLSFAVDRDGRVAGLFVKQTHAVDGDLPGDPSAWPRLDIDAHAALCAEMGQRVEAALPVVELHFRSPRKSEQQQQQNPMNRQDQRRLLPRMTARGVQVDERRVLVLAQIDAEQTSRLERIVVRSAGQRLAARFVGSLRDWSALLVESEAPLPGEALELADADCYQLLDRLLPVAVMEMHGEEAALRLWHTRVVDVRRGIHDQLRPWVAEPEGDLFIFAEPGRLIALPAQRRQEAQARTETVAANVFARILADPTPFFDPAIAPLAEAEENRLAWLGVELQPLNAELARANRVSELSRDGAIGGLVCFVYPGSPAERGGLQVGDVLLRLEVEGEPKPVPVQPGNMAIPYFPWDQLDELPERYYDRLPTPWPRRVNDFTRTLTDLGIGRAFVIESARDGSVQRLPMQVEEGPPHFDSSPGFKSEVLGMTVRELSYEVRRYFQKDDDAPGLIAAKVEPGALAAVAGVRPFELITHVDGQPVSTVADFERLLAASEGTLRLHLERLLKRRIVKIRLP